MLTYEDEPTIRNAIMKRLHNKARGWGVADIKIFNMTDHIRVGVWLILEKLATPDAIPDLRAWFDLPSEFYLRQVHNEIDEIAEQAKAAEKKHRHTGIIVPAGMSTPNHQREFLPGTGLRGSWGKDEQRLQARKSSSGR